MPIVDTITYNFDGDPEFNSIKTQLIIGTNIFHMRKYRGLSQQELAHKASTTQKIISSLENGDYNPSVEMLSKIANALDIKIELLMKEKMNWRFLEVLNYLVNRVKNVDVLKAMKLLYFIDLEANDINGYKFTGLEYFRRHAGPFNKDIYLMDEFFDKKGESNKFEAKEYFGCYVELNKNDFKFLDNMIDKYGDLTTVQIADLSYKTEPMDGLEKGDSRKMGKLVF